MENNIENNVEFKKFFKKQMMNTIRKFLYEQIPFTILIYNNNNWNEPLPIDIMETPEYKEVLPISVSNFTLESSYYDDDEITIVTAFGEWEYNKILLEDELLAILDINGKPIIIKPFIDEAEEKSVNKINENDIFEDIDDKDIKKSINIFLENNTYK